MEELYRYSEVLDLADDQPSAIDVHFWDDDEIVRLKLDINHWRQMGRPTEVTVTFEAGDTLTKRFRNDWTRLAHDIAEVAASLRDQGLLPPAPARRVSPTGRVLGPAPALQPRH